MFVSIRYTSMHRTEEQKIIYSGQLLDDNAILKDVLRTYESQIVHTMHLVCAPNRRMPDPTPKPAETVPEGLRRRNVEPERTEAARPETRQNDQNHNVEMQNYISSFVNNYGRVPPYPNYGIGEGYLPVPNDPASLANHMMMMQQAYLQYMQQYANMWQATANAGPAAAPAQPEAPPQPPAEVPPQPEEGEEGLAGRDWLDIVYAASRLAILFSLVYLYGSPARLLLVLLLVAAGYLHQIGFFRDLHVNPANNEQAQNNQPNQPNEPNRPANTPATDDATATNPPPARDDQSILDFTRMVFTSFFASLIPDTNY
ncbi:hypothetical protein O3G_MSEX002872 [Manduca sexta]|uniref:Homocysteine-responsive endoplasmic reticulum-resident ubiquitin-like domain member 2 protein n=1 Tax=Manduca sexta TaxID=7130 RepID=A0A921YQ90_MANSE|nr:hypothetical protein O3G_MSEX002872 [Manduca sexta]